MNKKFSTLLAGVALLSAAYSGAYPFTFRQLIKA